MEIITINLHKNIFRRFHSVKPKVFTNNPSKKMSKYEKEQMLREFKHQRAKGTEEWNKNQKRKTVGSKYKKNEVIF